MDWNIEERHLGPLKTTTVQPPGEAEPVLAVVLCHGFGAPGTDLVGLGPELLARLGEEGRGVKFYFPAAPLSLASVGMPGGRAWWMLDMELLAAAAEGRIERDQRNEVPDGMSAAVDMLKQSVEAILSETGLAADRLVLGGFSQGAMVATDLALRWPASPAALLIYSGTLLCEDQWKELASRRGPLKVLQSHGTRDPLLPFRMAVELKQLLADAGSSVEFLEFAGPHTIPPAALASTESMLGSILAAR